MKVVILAGGYGTRLSEYTSSLPKPMVTIGDKPILWHIMNTYAKYGFNDFNIALGYKAERIKEFFLTYKELNSDFTINLLTGNTSFHQIEETDWKVTLVDTGLASMTGGRVKRMQEYVGNETFMLTYGDGLADINIRALVDFHKSHGKVITVSATHPAARFGELDILGDKVISFEEKPQMMNGWINGGYFVIEPSFFELIDGDDTILEKKPLERASQMGELMAFHHTGFWQCMDTKRDRDHLEDLWRSGSAPWAT